jgi:hypothetical protein
MPGGHGLDRLAREVHGFLVQRGVVREPIQRVQGEGEVAEALGAVGMVRPRGRHRFPGLLHGRPRELGQIGDQARPGQAGGHRGRPEPIEKLV